MKKFTFLLMLMLAYAGFAMAQTVEDFESIKMNDFGQGSTGKTTVVPNPDPTGINTSLYVAKFHRAKDGNTYQGWYTTIATPINVTNNRYLHLKLWKPRVSPTCFKVEGGAGDSGDTYPMTEYSNVGHWEEVVYDFTTSPNNPKPSGEYVKIVLIPDFEVPAVTLTQDIDLYFDDMYVNNDPAVGSAPVTMIENFEVIPLNYMLNGANDNSSMVVVDNPDKSGVNISDHVIKFNRDKDGSPWDGFWSKIGDYSQPLDITTNKYVHVKVWKPRVSPVFFKIEGGNGTPAYLEKASDAPQTKVGQWEDVVWDFSTMPATTYPIIGLQPDREDPVTLTEDLTMYFDDIILNNDPNPIQPPQQIFQIDMNGSTITAADHLWITGSFGGIYGTWAEPGSNPNNELTDPDGDGIYTIYLSVPNQVVEFKFFINSGWDPANPGFDPYGKNRSYTITGDCNVVFTWGVGGVEVSARENQLAGKIQMYPNPVRNELNINTTSDIRKVIITSTLGKVVGNSVYVNNKTINTTNLSKGMYFVTFVGADGTKVTQKLIKD